MKCYFIFILFFIKFARAESNTCRKGFEERNIFFKENYISDTGYLKILRKDDRFYFGISDSLLGRDVMVVTRISKASSSVIRPMPIVGYAGDKVNESVIRFEKGMPHKLLLRCVNFGERSVDSTDQGMWRAVTNSSLHPIFWTFDIINPVQKNSISLVDVTELLNSDNDFIFVNNISKNALGITSFHSDKSYIIDIHSFPDNVCLNTTKTYANSAGSLSSFGLTTSFLLLPRIPMQIRYADPRVGYYLQHLTDFDIDPQGVKKISAITRWRLEPKPGDLNRYLKGEIVEPRKPIIFYIDPATPKKWVKYLIQGINDWQPAFEQAGFKNAIFGRMAPTKEEDSTWSLGDARFSNIVYMASDIQDASYSTVVDPRSGEILESDIRWYHNIMKLLRNRYFILASPSDPKARNVELEEELMGLLIRNTCSHEIGHALGFPHNFGSSSSVPVKSLRDRKWLEINGICPSIMDYARFDYVAQPEDSIKDFYLLSSRIGDYDKWAIQWGYKYYGLSAGEERDSLICLIKLKKDKKFWYGSEINEKDPRCQAEDLGDDAILANYYGIKNLQYIESHLMDWVKTGNADCNDLITLYNVLIEQFSIYLWHVANNIGGTYENLETILDKGAIYEPVPKHIQEMSIQFLCEQCFNTPRWLLDT